jgi:hypothetical protein
MGKFGTTVRDDASRAERVEWSRIAKDRVISGLAWYDRLFSPRTPRVFDTRCHTQQKKTVIRRRLLAKQYEARERRRKSEFANTLVFVCVDSECYYSFVINTLSHHFGATFGTLCYHHIWLSSLFRWFPSTLCRPFCDVLPLCYLATLAHRSSSVLRDHGGLCSTRRSHCRYYGTYHILFRLFGSVCEFRLPFTTIPEQRSFRVHIWWGYCGLWSLGHYGGREWHIHMTHLCACRERERNVKSAGLPHSRSTYTTTAS